MHVEVLFMAFKIYFNKKTGHPSISLSGKDKTIWENLEMTHHPKNNDRYIDIVCLSSNGSSKSYVRKYIRHDKKGVKSKKPKKQKLTDTSEIKVKQFLSDCHKKR